MLKLQHGAAKLWHRYGEEDDTGEGVWEETRSTGSTVYWEYKTRACCMSLWLNSHTYLLYSPGSFFRKETGKQIWALQTIDPLFSACLLFQWEHYSEVFSLSVFELISLKYKVNNFFPHKHSLSCLQLNLWCKPIKAIILIIQHYRSRYSQIQ